MRDYSLILRTPVHKLANKTDTPTPIPNGNITDISAKWRRNTTFMGGADVGNFRIYDTIPNLVRYYSTWLGLDLIERSAGLITWNGQVQRLTLAMGIIPVTYDLTDMFNTVRSTIGNGIGTYTAEASNAASVAQFGRRRMIITPGVATQADAEDERDKFLKLNAYPSETGKGVTDPGGPAYLDVHVAGYIHTLNNDYAPDHLIDETDTVATAISTAIGYSQYLTLRKAAANATVIRDDVEMIRNGDFIRKMLEITDNSENIFRGYVDNDRNFNYEIVSTTPQNFIRNYNVHSTSGGEMLVKSRQIVPGIFRNLDNPFSSPNRDAFLEQRRDLFVEDIYVDEQGAFGLRPEGGVSDYLMFIRSNVSAGGGSDDDDGGPGKWVWSEMTDEEKDAYIEKHEGEPGF
jgi:hypothetical protein